MADPIVKVFDADGNRVHDCEAAGCQTSWNGYVLIDGYTVDVYNPDAGELVSSSPLAKGSRVEGARDPGPEWDTSRPGEAHRLS